jgi:hypothetical protein
LKSVLAKHLTDLPILKIKSEKIKDDSKLTNVMKEYFYLQNLLNEELEVTEENEDFKRLLENQ